MVAVDPGQVVDASAVADLWVDLAADQREYGSHLLADENREAIRDVMARRAVAGELLVARSSDSESGRKSDRESDRTPDWRDIVGFVTFGVESGRYESDAVRGAIENVFVVPDRRGEGVGSELLAAAEHALVDGGADVLSLEAMADNEAALRFYRRHGYSPQRVELEKWVESDTLTKE
ncbi:GNAT family N-acetyltransferase [Halorussus litoreus]|uniref:GNAT family N-acetyltransferase n=1 Tax=Halorussus litoreus TaxID=1710536 RepID=UPI000E27090B|nr:GNAT family N-acetyltransferase [Halorussus litoreus]